MTKFDKKVVERQLVASGLVQAVQASRAGFSDHLPPDKMPWSARGGPPAAGGGASPGTPLL